MLGRKFTCAYRRKGQCALLFVLALACLKAGVDDGVFVVITGSAKKNAVTDKVLWTCWVACAYISQR
jgi:hypothetical protein